ncbi:hypothetical protein BH18ACT1_BH18ACT1_18950 [soil metagenome]
MADTVTSTANRAFSMQTRVRGDGTARALQRRRPLPGTRAVVGGFLVAAAVVGVVAVSSTADSAPATAYVVVTADVDAGARLRPGDLDLVPLDLPAAQRGVSFTDRSVLDGATALAALSKGQLVQSSDVAKPPSGPGLASISLPVERGRALNGDLQRGDRVDVLVTYTDGGDPSTRTVSAGATVLDVLDGRGGALTGTGGLSVALAVPPAEVADVAQAGAVGTVTLARTTGIPAGG